MAFQFKCSECNAHIEVDDEYRDKQVTCPYCRKPTVASETHVSADGAATADGSQLAAGGVVLPQEERRKSSLGWIALAVTIIGGVALILTAFGAAKVFGGVDWQSMTQEERTQTVQSLRQANPSLRIFGILGACVAPIAAIVLSIITIAKKYTPKWPAILSLVLIGLFVALPCVGILTKGMAAAQQSGTSP